LANGSYLLDTNVIIAIFGKDSSILEPLSRAKEIFVPVIAIGELYYGAHYSTRPQENVCKITEFASVARVLGCDIITSEIYGIIKASLRMKGTPIPENDIWIAAIAKQHGLTLVTRDTHFHEVEGIDLAHW